MSVKIDYTNRPISVEVRGLDGLRKFLKDAPRGCTVEAIRAYAEYLLGNEQRGLRHYPARVQHGKDNPYQWQSEKQRKAYFASNGFGKGIPYQRTGDLGRAWHIVERMDGYQSRIVNDLDYADFVQGVVQQRGHWADKWRKARDIVATNTQGAIHAAQLAVNRWLKAKAK